MSIKIENPLRFFSPQLSDSWKLRFSSAPPVVTPELYASRIARPIPKERKMLATENARSVQSHSTREQHDRTGVVVFGLDQAFAIEGRPRWLEADCHDTLKETAICETTVRLAKRVGGWRKPDGDGAWTFVVADNGAFYGVYWSTHRRLGFSVPPHPTTEKLLADGSGNYQVFRLHLERDLSSIPDLFTEHQKRWEESPPDSRIDATEYLKDDLNDIRVRAAECLATTRPKGPEKSASCPAVAGDDIEFFVPADESLSPRSRDRRGSPPPPPDWCAVARQLLADYSDDQTYTSFAGPCPLPSRSKVVRITKAFFPLLFPGYYGPRPNSSHFRTFLERRLVWLRKQLAMQINRALHFQHKSEEPSNWIEWDDNDYAEWAEGKAEALLATLPRIRRLLDDDVKAALNGDPAVWSHHEIVAAYPGLYATAVYRLAHELDEAGVPLIPRMMTEHAHSKTGIDIHPGASIQGGFFIDHGSGVVVGATSEIGHNVKLYQGVTLGAISFPRDENGQLIRGEKRHPTLEDNVVVYANASVLGGDTVIGRNSVIGANVKICQSVLPEKIASVEEHTLRFKDRPKPAPKGQQYSI
jgi:serine O-acetyltransferase